MLREFERLGKRARPSLERAARGGSARARGRARRLLLLAQRERVARRLAVFAAGGADDLERGLFLLGRFEDPRLDARGYLVALDAMAAEVARRIENRPPDAARALELCTYLGGSLGYTGDHDDYRHPDNAYLHRVIERKRGLPLTLTALYLAVARRAGLRAAPVALPGHVLLRLYGADRNVLVDPFQAGEVLEERECLAYLAQHGLPFRSEWFADAPDRELFSRQLRNLIASYSERGLRREVRLLERVHAVFEQAAEAALSTSTESR